MISSFADAGTEDIYDGRDTKAARRACPRRICFSWGHAGAEGIEIIDYH